MYPVQSHLVRTNAVFISGIGMDPSEAINLVKDAKEIERQREERERIAREEAKDLTTAKMSIGQQDPVFLAAIADYEKGPIKAHVGYVKGTDWASLTQKMETAGRSALNKLAAFYPYKGFLIKPVLYQEYKKIGFNVLSGKRQKLIGPIQRVEEAKAWIDREVSRDQAKEIKLYNEAYKSAISKTLPVITAQVERTEDLIKEQREYLQKGKTEPKEKTKLTPILLISGAAAAGLMLMKGS